MNQRIGRIGAICACFITLAMAEGRAQAFSFGWQHPSTDGATATSVSPNWVVGAGSFYYDIYELNGSSFDQVFGRGGGITTDVNGNPWVLGQQAMYDWNGVDFSTFDTSKLWMTVGVYDSSGDYRVWATDLFSNIWVRNTAGWAQIPGAALKVAVFSDTMACGGMTIHVPFIINSSHEIFRYEMQSYGGCTAGTECDEGCFNPVPGAAEDIARDWVLGTDGNVYLWNGSSWTYFQGPPAGHTITGIGANGGWPWAITSDSTNNVWEMTAYE